MRFRYECEKSHTGNKEEAATHARIVRDSERNSPLLKGRIKHSILCNFLCDTSTATPRVRNTSISYHVLISETRVDDNLDYVNDGDVWG